MSYANALSKVDELMQKVQQLESENAALRQQLEDVKRVRYSIEGALADAYDEAEACWEDKERLDWLEANLYTLFACGLRCNESPPVEIAARGGRYEAESIRAAIDAARKEAKP